MCLNLSDYQFKTSKYNYRSTYMNSTVRANQKPTIGTQKLQRKKHKHNTKENHQTTREETKRRRKKQGRTTKTTRKQVIKWQ